MYEDMIGKTIDVIRRNSNGEIITMVINDPRDAEYVEKQCMIICTIKLLESDVLTPGIGTMMQIIEEAIKQGVRWGQNNPGKEIR